MLKQLAALRQRMKEQNITVYYVSSQDEHGSEYVSDHYKCREYLSGFTGSAGSLVITQESAALFTDGRYFLQAEQQLRNSGYTLMRMGDPGVPSVAEYMAQVAGTQAVIGYDARMISVLQEKNLLKQVADGISKGNIKIRRDCDLAGEVWEQSGSRPKQEFHEIFYWENQYSGQDISEKIQNMQQYLQQKQLQGYVFSALDEIAWLLNMRGSDILCNPVFQSFLLFYEGTVVLYCDPDALCAECRAVLVKNAIQVHAYQDFYKELQQLQTAVIGYDAAGVNAWIGQLLGSAAVECASPVSSWKAVKNATEIAGERACHIRDGVAFVRFLYWLKKKCHFQADGILVDENGCEVTERTAAAHLIEERKAQKYYQGESFEPIVACAQHGAVVHYSATKESDIPLQKDTFVLMDTGGQYLDGTTDITRTIVLGTVSDQMKSLYTAVLKGNLALLHAVFKEGCRGENLDILARKPLWDMGYDFNHGTGHGVGCFLNVHEGPNAIRYRIRKESDPTAVLQPGMITSDEPGVYLTGQFGIRLENLILCEEKQQTEFGRFLGFQCLTMVPFDREAIAWERMDEKSREWLTQYHKEVYNCLSPYLEEDCRNWLYEITQ